jgi:hypothetical protein
MKRANVVMWVMVACAAACGRQTLDLPPLSGSGAGSSSPGGGAGGSSPSGGAGATGGASPAARFTAVVADHAPPSELGRDCVQAVDCSWWQDPDPVMFCCEGICTNTAADPQSCGACGRTCARGEVCTDGRCHAPAVPVFGDTSIAPELTLGGDCAIIACAAGQICCNGACVEPQSNRGDCGACGVACRFSGASCIAGACCSGLPTEGPCRSARCDGLLVLCGDGCKDLGTDANNCGACGAVCPASARRCVAGLCVGLSP